MADTLTVITKPGVLAFGEGLPAGSSITTFFQDETVIQVSCYRDHSAVVCESGRVYTFGKNQDNGWAAKDADEIAGPRLVASLSAVRITQAACGLQYTLFLTDKGELYSCGLNDQGQLGLGHKDKVLTPVLVTGLPPIKKLTAGRQHTVALTDNGQVWVSGKNDFGQLGLGHTNQQTSLTQVMSHLHEPIVDISCGSRHTALITSSQVLLVTGYNKYGQLGLGGVENVASFIPVSTLSTPITAVSCGYFHTVVLTEDGTCWAWGRNVCGQLGTGTKDDKTTAAKVVGLEGQTVSQVIAGCNHTAVLTQEGDMWVWGRGRCGELSLRKQDLLKPTLLTKSPGLLVQQVAFAGAYSLLLVVQSSTKTPRPQTGVTDEVDPANDPVTDEERGIMRSLECPVCMRIMCAPIHLCANGHSLCGACRASPHMTACPQCRGPLIDTRNIALESLSEIVRVPCTECLVRGPASEAERHGQVCPRRRYVCPVDGGCNWSGRPHAMLAHTTLDHPDNTWASLPHMFVQTAPADVLMSAHGQVFTLHRRYGGRFQAAVRYLGLPGGARDYRLELTIITDNQDHVYLSNVCPDTEDIDDIFKSANCVSIEREVGKTLLQRGHLVCQVAILKVQRTSNLTDRMKALLSRQE